jgi:hypothetical protein
VTEPSGPPPQRIGDAERDRAVEYLRDHLAEGRLDQTEFDDRLTQALTARTQADLDPLFHDLPGPKPGQALAKGGDFQAPPWQSTPSQSVAARPASATPVQTKFSTAWGVASGLAWPAAIILCFATNWQFWWIMLIPIFITGIGGQQHGRHNQNNRHHH